MYKHIKSCVLRMPKRRPSGDHLSPLIFSIYLNDVEQFLISKGNMGMNLISSGDVRFYFTLLVLLYVDDTVLLADDKNALQK